ncbi:MAG: DUF167 domain-containing protein [Candidatus Yanofskybacteria bacterium]|nr:DUF167 domain-containing protein [Candidatus Yanofskybacteria bacterium]
MDQLGCCRVHRLARLVRIEKIRMRISIKAKPSSHEEKVVKISDTEFIVSVKEPPVKGLANRAILHALSKHLGIAQVRVRIVSGYTSRQKVVEVL